MKKWAAVYALTAVLVLVISLGTRDVITVWSESAPIDREHVIVIDPGHGGEDGGASSCTGALESGINLQISLKLQDLFQLLGHHVVMIRTTDTSVYTKGETLAQKKMSDLKRRVEIVNETPEAILISIHQNTFSQEKYCGAQVFYGDAPGSKELAQMLQSAFTSTINPESNRKCKKSQGVYLMEHVKPTAVLIECGFLSNIQEEALLRNGEYQKNICCVICAVVSQFVSNS